MLLPPTGAGAAQLAWAWTHQSLTESLVFFFLHVQGLKMGRIQPISAQQTLFHLICAFTQVLFSSSPFQVEVSVVSPPTPGCCHCKTRHIRSLKSLKPDQNTICSSSHLSLIVKGHLYGTDPDTFQTLKSLLLSLRRVWLWACGLLPFPQFLYALYVSFYFQYSIQKFGVQAEKRQNTDFYPIFGAAFSLLNYNWEH